MRVGQRAEAQFVPAAQPFPRFANQGERGFEPNAIRFRLKHIHGSPSRRTGRAQPEQFPQLVKLEHFLRGACHFFYLR